MLSVDDPIVRDWHDLLMELATIEREIATVEGTSGVSVDSLVARRRVHTARSHILRQLRALLDGGDIGRPTSLH